MCDVHSVVLILYLQYMQNKQEEADEVKRRFAGKSRSDHIALLNAYKVFCTASAHV